MGRLTKNSEYLYIVINVNDNESDEFILECQPTTKEEAEYFVGRNPNYEMVGLRVISRQRGVYSNKQA